MKTYGSSWNVLNEFCNIIFTVEKFEILYNSTLYILLQSFENIRFGHYFLVNFLGLACHVKSSGVPREIISRATFGHACHRFATAGISERGAGDRNDEESEREKENGKEGDWEKVWSVVQVQTIVYFAKVRSHISRFLISLEMIHVDDAIKSDHDILNNRQTGFEYEKILLISFRY